VVSVVDDFRFLNLIFLIPPLVKFAEIMPDFLATESIEITDSCALSEIGFTSPLVNKNNQ
jgi:hypothetical protein